MQWIKDTFNTRKPIIAMCHVRALPGDPYFSGDMEQVVDQARAEFLALQEGGVDAVMFSNSIQPPLSDEDGACHDRLHGTYHRRAEERD